MTPTSSIQFIDTALFEGKPSPEFLLSYNDPDQKWLIRNHLISLLNDFPSLVPSIDTFIHSDGTSMNLLNFTGFLQTPNYLPDVPLIIWLHENYPFTAPIVFILQNPECPVYRNHPFIDPSGVVSPPYILNWNQTRSNLLDFVHDLVKLFQHDQYHPSMPCFVLKNTILDELQGKIYVDIEALEARNGDSIEKWYTTQEEIRTRTDFADGIITSVENERTNLEIKVMELRKFNDNLFDWLKNSKNLGLMGQVEGLICHDHVFVAADEESKLVLDCLSIDRAMEDVTYALDEALERGVVSFDVYMKQVRMVAREQFLNRAKLVKFKGPHVLHCLS